MIERYQDLQITKIWNKEHQLTVWTKIECLVIEYWHKVGLIPDPDYNQLRHFQPDFKDLQTIEKHTGHEIAAFVEMLTQQVGSAGKWIHYGLTSNDILDTSQNYLLKASSTYVQNELETLLSILKQYAYQEKTTICLGRTHGVVAEPITLGYKFALWFKEIEYHFQTLITVTAQINCVKILGPTGMNSHFDPSLAEHVAKNLEMAVANVGTQLFGRYHLISFFNCLTNLVISIEKMATEIRNLHRTEINELNEGFGIQQKGSSAMPHKKNPIFCENICSLARLLRSMQTSLQFSNLTWHERDLTNSAIERVVLPDFFHLLVTIIKRFTEVLTNLKINHHQIQHNLNKYQDDLFSHKIMLTLLKYSQLNREHAYKLVQKSSFWAKEQQSTLYEGLLRHNILEHLSYQQLKECFNLKSFIRNLDHLFNDIFTNNASS